MTGGEQEHGSLPPPVSTRHQIALYSQRGIYDVMEPQVSVSSSNPVHPHAPLLSLI